MYLHLGQDVVVRSEEIIGIFDIERASVSALTRGFLKSAQKSGAVFNVSDKMPKSFVVCGSIAGAERKKLLVYISPISPATLKKRGKIMNLTGMG